MNKNSVASLIITGIVSIFLYAVFVRPSGYLIADAAILSVIGFVFAVRGFTGERARTETIPVVLSSITMAVTLAIFLIMIALGA